MRAAAVSFVIMLGVAPISAQGTGGAGPMQDPSGRIVIDLGLKQRSDGIVWLAVRTGPLPHGTVLTLSTENGSWSEALTPFGVRTGVAELVFQVGIPGASVAGSTVVLTAEISSPGEPTRPPTPEELQEIAPVPDCRG